MIRSMVFGMIALASLASAPVAQAQWESTEPSMGAEAGISSGYYLCQKKNCYGQWQTVYVCYSRCKALDWYNNQPSNARVIAVK